MGRSYPVGATRPNAGLPSRGAPWVTTVEAYTPYRVKPNVADRKTPICSRVTEAVGQ